MTLAERQYGYIELMGEWFGEFGPAAEKRIRAELTRIGSLETVLHYLQLVGPDHIEDQLDVLRNYIRRYGVENFLFQLKLHTQPAAIVDGPEPVAVDESEMETVSLEEFLEPIPRKSKKREYNGPERRNRGDRRKRADRRRRDDAIFHNMRTGEDRRASFGRRSDDWPIQDSA